MTILAHVIVCTDRPSQVIACDNDPVRRRALGPESVQTAPRSEPVTDDWSSTLATAVTLA